MTTTTDDDSNDDDSTDNGNDKQMSVGVHVNVIAQQIMPHPAPPDLFFFGTNHHRRRPPAPARLLVELNRAPELPRILPPPLSLSCHIDGLLSLWCLCYYRQPVGALFFFFVHRLRTVRPAGALQRA
jgi:hypothetical protein